MKPVLEDKPGVKVVGIINDCARAGEYHEKEKLFILWNSLHTFIDSSYGVDSFAGLPANESGPDGLLVNRTMAGDVLLEYKCIARDPGIYHLATKVRCVKDGTARVIQLESQPVVLVVFPSENYFADVEAGKIADADNGLVRRPLTAANLRVHLTKCLQALESESKHPFTKIAIKAPVP